MMGRGRWSEVICGLGSASPVRTSFMRLEALICVVVEWKWSCGSEHRHTHIAWITITVESDILYLIHRGLDAPVRLHVLFVVVSRLGQSIH